MPELPELPRVPLGDEPRPAEVAVPSPAPRASAGVEMPVRRFHFVVVATAPIEPRHESPAGSVLVSRFWHPRERRWVETSFESLEHLLHLFVDENGWVLRQQQALDGPNRFELIFEAPREVFSRPSTERLLEEELGMSRQELAEMLERVDERVEREGGAE